MVSSAAKFDPMAIAKAVRITDESITVDLKDGRTVSIPTKWYPRLLYATTAEREDYEIDEYGVVWRSVEADFSIRGILLGQKSGESAVSFKFWLDGRRKGRKVMFEDYMRQKRSKKTATHKRGSVSRH